MKDLLNMIILKCNAHKNWAFNNENFVTFVDKPYNGLCFASAQIYFVYLQSD